MMNSILHKSIYKRCETSNIKDKKHKKFESFKTFYLIVVLIKKPSGSKG